MVIKNFLFSTPGNYVFGIFAAMCGVFPFPLLSVLVIPDTRVIKGKQSSDSLNTDNVE